MGGIIICNKDYSKLAESNEVDSESGKMCCVTCGRIVDAGGLIRFLNKKRIQKAKNKIIWMMNNYETI